MSTELLEEQVKTRVPKSVKRSMEQLAERRGLKAADIAREAFREYLAKNDPAQLELGTGAEKRRAA